MLNMTTEFILSQIFVAIQYIILIFSYCTKNRKTLLVINFASNISIAISFILLGAWSGFASSMVALIRMIVLLIKNRYSKTDNEKITKADVFILIFLILLCIAAALITYQGPLSLLSILGTMIVTISLWQKNVTVYKILGIPNSICWFIYNIFIWSPLAFILESVLFVVIIVSLIIHVVKLCKQKKNKNIQNTSSDNQDLKTQTIETKI